LKELRGIDGFATTVEMCGKVKSRNERGGTTVCKKQNRKC